MFPIVWWRSNTQYTQLAETAFEIVERQVEGKSKKFIKGGRLHLYPTGMNIYRCSRGVKRPTITKMTYRQAMSMTKNIAKTYEKTTRITMPDGYENTIYTQYYNRAKKKDIENE